MEKNELGGGEQQKLSVVVFIVCLRYKQCLMARGKCLFARSMSSLVFGFLWSEFREEFSMSVQSTREVICLPSLSFPSRKSRKGKTFHCVNFCRRWQRSFPHSAVRASTKTSKGSEKLLSYERKTFIDKNWLKLWSFLLALSPPEKKTLVDCGNFHRLENWLGWAEASWRLKTKTRIFRKLSTKMLEIRSYLEAWMEMGWTELTWKREEKNSKYEFMNLFYTTQKVTIKVQGRSERAVMKKPSKKPFRWKIYDRNFPFFEFFHH